MIPPAEKKEGRMNIFLRGGIAVALGLGLAGGALVANPAFAQKKKEAAGSKYSKSLLTAIGAPTKAGEKSAIETEIAGQQWDAATARVRAAEAATDLTQDDKDLLGVFKIQVGQGSKNDALLREGLETRMAAGKISAEEQTSYTRNLAALAIRGNDYNAAAAQLEKLAAANPADVQTLTDLGAIYSRQKKIPQAIAAYERAAKASEAAGQKAPEALYGSRLKLAYDNKLTDQIEPAAIALVRAYPSPNNWNAALYALRGSAQMDPQTELDVFRLTRAAGAVQGGAEYIDYANAAQMRGLPAEARSVLQEGMTKGVVAPGNQTGKELSALLSPARINADKASLPQSEKDARAAKTGKLARATADAYLGHGDYAKAAELYDLASQKGGEDAALLNTRIGIAKAMAGDKAAAQASFAKVQGGQRGSLARYWEVWLEQKA